MIVNLFDFFKQDVSMHKLLNFFSRAFFLISCVFIKGMENEVASDAITNKIDVLMQVYTDLGKFSGAVLISKNNKILLSKGYGFANHEHDIPNTVQTKFRIASLTKQFTALAIMQLHEQKLLSLEDSLSRFIPDFLHGNKITIHHLLTHMSGLNDNEIKKEQPMKEGVVESLKNAPLDFEPGARYQYSNGGYIILTYLIEKISGISYEKFLEENIFKPSGMYNSGYDHGDTVLKNRAAGYVLNSDGLKNAPYIDMSNPSGAGGLYSTVGDLNVWNYALYNAHLISESSLTAMTTAWAEMHKADVHSNQVDYGYGLFIEKLGSAFNDSIFIGHTGGISGFCSFLAYFPTEALTVVIVSNFRHAPTNSIFYKGIVPILFDKSYELPEKEDHHQC